MKEYPLTDSDLNNLRTLGMGAVLSFSVGSILIGVWSNIATSMAFVSDAPKELIAVWADRERFTLLGAIFSYGIGIILVLLGYTRVEEIKSEVEFADGDGFRPKRWIRAIVIFIATVLIAGGGYWLGRNT